MAVDNTADLHVLFWTDCLCCSCIQKLLDVSFG